MVYRIYVEKKPGFDVEANGLKNELTSLLGIKDLTGLRLLNRYDVEGIDEALFNQCVSTVFSEPPVDNTYAELPAADLAQVRPGMPATLTSPAGQPVTGKVRAVAPSVDPQTRNGLVYVDLPPTAAVRAGMFARGEFELGRSPAVTLPQTAVVLREGFAYVYRLEGEDRVAQTKVKTGRQRGDAIEILDGLADGVRVVASGAGFLADGDRVQVVTGAQ